MCAIANEKLYPSEIVNDCQTTTKYLQRLSVFIFLFKIKTISSHTSHTYYCIDLKWEMEMMTSTLRTTVMSEMEESST